MAGGSYTISGIFFYPPGGGTTPRIRTIETWMAKKAFSRNREKNEIERILAKRAFSRNREKPEIERI